MNEKTRRLTMDIINGMINESEQVLNEKGLEKFIYFKIEARELRTGDYSLGESIIIDEIKEWQEKEKEK